MNGKKIVQRVYEEFSDWGDIESQYYVYRLERNNLWSISKGDYTKGYDQTQKIADGVLYSVPVGKYNGGLFGESASTEMILMNDIPRNHLPTVVQESLNIFAKKFPPPQSNLPTLSVEIVGALEGLPYNFSPEKIKRLAALKTYNEIDSKKFFEEMENPSSATNVKSRQIDAQLKKMQQDHDRDVSNALTTFITGAVSTIAESNIEHKRMKQQKKVAAEQAQIRTQQAQQAQVEANNRQLADYDRQYVKHDAPVSQNQSSGNYAASSDNSNSSNTNQQARPHKERVNLPSQTGCINMGKSNKQDPTSDTRWFLLKNSCAYPVKVRWCAGQGCVNSSSAADIPSGGAHEVWAKKDNDGKIHLNLMACQESSGSDEVFTDWPTKQCWANVEMN